MNEYVRHEMMVNLVNEEGSVTVSSLVDQLNVSPATVRRDINKLSEEGKVLKIRNGIARLKQESSKSIANIFDIEFSKNYDEKIKIAEMAAELCQPGDNVVINCGSTAFLLGKKLCGNPVSIVTNYFPLACYLIENEHENVIIMGGQYNKSQKIILAPLNDFSRFYGGKIMFTSGKYFSAQGLYKSEVLTAVSEQQILDKVEKIIVVVDSSKIVDKVDGGMLFCETSQIDTLITGKEANPEIIKMIRDQGVNIILV